MYCVLFYYEKNRTIHNTYTIINKYNKKERRACTAAELDIIMKEEIGKQKKTFSRKRMNKTRKNI